MHYLWKENLKSGQSGSLQLYTATLQKYVAKDLPGSHESYDIVDISNMNAFPQMKTHVTFSTWIVCVR